MEGQATANPVTDAHLAALAIEHGCELASTDSDFARFPKLKWQNPSPSRASHNFGPDRVDEFQLLNGNIPLAETIHAKNSGIKAQYFPGFVGGRNISSVLSIHKKATDYV